MMLSEALSLYRQEMVRIQWAASTQLRYGSELARFVREVGDVPVGDVTVWTVRGFLDQFNELAPATARLELGILHGFFTWLLDEDVIEVSPTARIKPPKVPKVRTVTRISADQVRAMLAEARTPTEVLCLYVLAYTGARRGSANDLRWMDVDFKRNAVTFRTAKGDKPYSIPLASELRAVLVRYLLGSQLRPEDWVIPSRRPTGRTDSRNDRLIWHATKAVAKRCGIKAHCHAFRAAFATHFLMSNPDQLEACRALMNHDSVATTQRYLDQLDHQRLMQIVTTLSFVASDAGQSQHGGGDAGQSVAA